MLSPVEQSAHTVLGCRSRGVHLSPAMRLVALMFLLWESEWNAESGGRSSMSIEEIADRTSLEDHAVATTLERLANVSLIEQRADGWILTLDKWRTEVFPKWMERA